MNMSSLPLLKPTALLLCFPQAAESFYVEFIRHITQSLHPGHVIPDLPTLSTLTSRLVAVEEKMKEESLYS